MANHQQLGSKKGSGGGWRAAVIEMACSRTRTRKTKDNKEEEIKAPMSYKIHFGKVF